MVNFSNMNFLGHLYLSNDDLPLMTANLFGDYVKGKNYTHLPMVVQKGVRLHRKIDSFTDQHTSFKKVKQELYPELPKITPVAIDLYLDHLLAKYWSSFHSLPLHEFTERFLTYFFSTQRNQFNEPTTFIYPAAFIHLITMMKRYNWLNRYAQLEGLDMACTKLSQRIAFPNVLHKGKAVFLNHEKLITDAFWEFMQDAQTISCCD